jgi:hypothetical protein
MPNPFLDNITILDSDTDDEDKDSNAGPLFNSTRCAYSYLMHPMLTNPVLSYSPRTV